MSQQKKLEKVLDLLVNEDTGLATELLHQIIVEKARTIYESIVNEEDDEEDDIGDEVGGDSDEDFTDEISSDKDEIDADELNDGEAGAEDDEVDAELGDDEVDDEFGGEFGDDLGGDDERIDDLEDQLAQLRAEFDALMAQEVEEPNHADLDLDVAADDEFGGDDFGGDEFGGEDEFITASMYESKKLKAKEKANKAKEKEIDPKAKFKSKSKVDEETQFTKGVADTGQKGAAPGFAGTGKNTPKGAEQPRTPFTKAPSKPSYGGEPVDFTKGKGNAYGQYNGDSATDETPSDNVDEKQKSVGKTDTRDDWAGTGKESGSFGTQHKKSPFTKKPS